MNAESLLDIAVDSSGKVTANDQLVNATELYGYSGRFVPLADESKTTVILWKYIFDQYGSKEYETIKNGMTHDFGTPDDEGDVDDESIAYWDNSTTNVRMLLEYTHDSNLILYIYHINRESSSQGKESAGDSSKSSTINKNAPQSEKNYTHSCEADGCNNEGTNSIIGFSGNTEWYCNEHYQQMMDILDMMEEDVKKSKNNSTVHP